jgi:hypothetical protein
MKTMICSTAALLLLALAGCAPGAPVTEPVADDTACLTGQIWQLDVQDAARQLGESLASGGIEVVSTEGLGSHRVTYTDDGLVSSDIDVSYTITASLDAGSTLTLVQTHSGSNGGEWAWLDDSGVIAFSNWNVGDYQIQTQTLIDGVAAPNSVTTPSETLDGTDMEVLACTADMLSTHVAASPFTQVWHPAR